MGGKGSSGELPRTHRRALLSSFRSACWMRAGCAHALCSSSAPPVSVIRQRSAVRKRHGHVVEGVPGCECACAADRLIAPPCPQAFAGKFLCHRARGFYWLRLLQEYRNLFRCGQRLLNGQGSCLRTTRRAPLPTFAAAQIFHRAVTAAVSLLRTAPCPSAASRDGADMDAYIRDLEESRASNWTSLQPFDIDAHPQGYVSAGKSGRRELRWPRRSAFLR